MFDSSTGVNILFPLYIHMYTHLSVTQINYVLTFAPNWQITFHIPLNNVKFYLSNLNLILFSFEQNQQRKLCVSKTTEFFMIILRSCCLTLTQMTIYIYIYVLSLSIYIYIFRERERVRVRCPNGAVTNVVECDIVINKLDRTPVELIHSFLD